MPGKEQIEHRKLHRKIGKHREHRISYISYALLLVRKIRSLSWIHWKSWKHQSFRFTSRVCNDLLCVLWIALQSFWGRQFYVPVMMSGPLSWRGWLKICGPSRTKCKIGITVPEIKDDRRIEDDPPFVLQEFLNVTVDTVDTVVAVCGVCGRVAAVVLAPLYALQLLRLELFLSNSQTFFFKHDLKHVEN